MHILWNENEEVTPTELIKIAELLQDLDNCKMTTAFDLDSFQCGFEITIRD